MYCVAGSKHCSFLDAFAGAAVTSTNTNPVGTVFLVDRENSVHYFRGKPKATSTHGKSKYPCQRLLPDAPKAWHNVSNEKKGETKNNTNNLIIIQSLIYKV